MSWEHRGKGEYFYEARREGGRVVKTYFGNGPMAFAVSEAASRSRQALRMGAALHAAQRKRESDQWAEISSHGVDFSTYVDSVVRMTLGSWGYYRHKRGEWRKRRGFALSTAGENLTDMRPGPDTLSSSMLALADAFRNPTAQDAPAKAPIVASNWNSLGRNGILAALQLKGDSLTRLQEEAEELYISVAGSTPSPLESLLVERIVTNWLLVNEAEANLAHTAQRSTMPRIEYWERRVNHATARYLAAIRSLAQVRRLQLPTLNIGLTGSMQVNVGDKQVNLGAQRVAGDAQ